MLAEERRVIGVDLQAHGRTADIDRPMTFEAMADDVAALIGHLGLEEADVLGYSLGGGKRDAGGTGQGACRLRAKGSHCMLAWSRSYPQRCRMRDSGIALVATRRAPVGRPARRSIGGQFGYAPRRGRVFRGRTA